MHKIICFFVSIMFALSVYAGDTELKLGKNIFVSFLLDEVKFEEELLKTLGNTPVKDYTKQSGWNSGTLHAYLYKTGNNTILFDAGLPTVAGGNLREILAKNNISPKQVDIICITHMHFDHIGGLLDKSGKPLFENAKIYIGKEEHAFWSNNKNSIDATKSNFELAAKVLAAYRNQLVFFDQNASIINGVKSIPAFGHTPGHTMFEITSDKEKIMVMGDILHAAAQFTDQDIYLIYDANPKQAVATRKSALKKAFDEQIYIAGMHFPVPGYGKLQKVDKGYKFITK